MPRHILSLTLVVLAVVFTGSFAKPKPINALAAPAVTPISIYGAWHCEMIFVPGPLCAI